jgi:hypothetical protein
MVEATDGLALLGVRAMSQARRNDQFIAVSAGQMTMEVARETILADAEQTGLMWMPRIDTAFMKGIRRHYQRTGATSTTVDAVLDDVVAEAQRNGRSAAFAWITGFQAIAVLEVFASIDGALPEGDHSLLAHFKQRQDETFGEPPSVP